MNTIPWYIFVFLVIRTISIPTFTVAFISSRYAMNLSRIMALVCALAILEILIFFLLDKTNVVSDVPWLYSIAGLFILPCYAIAVQRTFQRLKKWQFFLHFLFLFALLIYINFNLPFFQQVFAHRFYAPIAGEKIKGGSVSCLNVNVVRSGGISDRNEFILMGGTAGQFKYLYSVNNKDFQTSKFSYIKREFTTCTPPPQTTVYYFPIFPAWSIFDNSPPEEKYWTNFYRATDALGIMSALYVFFSLGCIFINKQKISTT